MGIKKYKYLYFFFALFYVVMTGVDTVVNTIDAKEAGWLTTRLYFYAISSLPLIIAFIFGNHKAIAIVFGFTTIISGIILGIFNEAFSPGPAIFMGIGYWSVIDGFDIHKKYGVHIMWAFISFGVATAISIIKDFYFLNVVKNILLYLTSIPIGGLMVSDKAAKWIAGKLKEENDEA